MMVCMNKGLIFIARALFSLIFLFAGIRALMNWQGTLEGLYTLFSNWSLFVGERPLLKELLEWTMTKLPLLFGIALFLELFGGVLLITGIKVRLGALSLLLFLIPVTALFHPFWFEVGLDREREISAFLKNIALIGALLYFLSAPQPKKSAP